MTTKPTYHITPALRFPDFLNNGDWEVKRLGEIMQTITPPKKLQSIDYQKSGNYPIIDQSQNYICGYSNDVDALVNRTSEDLIVFGDHTCILKIVDFPFIQGADGIKIIKSKDSNQWDNKYVYQYLQFVPIISSEYKRHFSELKEKYVYYPKNIIEQRRIAACLSALDEMLAATNGKLEQLKAYKKGLMQKLFPAKGKKLPELRFKEFEKDGEWEVCSLETIFEIKNGYTPSKSNPKFWENGTLPWFRMEDIRLNGHILSDSIQHITPEAVKGSGLFPAYSIIVATTATIGEHALLIVDSLANQQFTFLTKRKSFDEKLDMMYFHYYMFIVDEWCKCNTNSGGLLSVNMLAFKKLRIPYPSNVDEQRKIADSFTSIDEMIKQYTNKATFLELYKKGLMQQMFPTSK